MAEGVQRNQGAGRLVSPEQLNDYLRVTNPKIWVLLVAIILLLVSLVVWSGLTTIESYATGTATAANGELTIVFDDAEKAQRVQAGMAVEIDDAQAEILTVGVDSEGNVVASSQANIPDGVYDIRVGYKTMQVISMLLN